MKFTKCQKVYVSSSDERHSGHNATITSIGSKYITTTDEYGRKQKFDKERYYCIDWSIYHLEESEESYKAKLVREAKIRFIYRNIYLLDSVLLDSEIDDIYNRLIQKYGKGK